MSDILIFTATYNEKENINNLINEIFNISKEVDILVIDDNSPDETWKILKKISEKNQNFFFIKRDKKLGLNTAHQMAYDYAISHNYKKLITMDADGQHRIEDVNSVFKPINDEVADIVIGSRFLDKKSEEMPNYRKVGIKIITKVTNLSIKEKLTDSQSGFRAYSKKALQKVIPSDVGMGVSTEILIKASNLELKVTEVPIKVHYDVDTSTHNPVSHGTSVILSTIKFTSIHNPLKFYGIPGIIFLIIGLGFIAWTIQIYVTSQQIITNVSLIGIGCIVLGAVLLMTAVILFSIVTVVSEKK